jgi:hypothetical protein
MHRVDALSMRLYRAGGQVGKSPLVSSSVLFSSPIRRPLHLSATVCPLACGLDVMFRIQEKRK